MLGQLHAMPSVGGRACSTEGSYITVAEWDWETVIQSSSASTACDRRSASGELFYESLWIWGILKKHLKNKSKQKNYWHGPLRLISIICLEVIASWLSSVWSTEQSIQPIFLATRSQIPVIPRTFYGNEFLLSKSCCSGCPCHRGNLY